jgi:hypothetical protein
MDRLAPVAGPNPLSLGGLRFGYLMAVQSRTLTTSSRGLGVTCGRCATFIAIDAVASGLALESCAPCPTCGGRAMYARIDLAQERK